MQNWILYPNLHVILIHYPLGVFILGALIEIFSFFWPRSSARTAARWMILLGALLMLPTIMSGVYALHDVTSGDTGGAALNAAQYHQMTWHIWLEGGAAALAALIVVVGLGASDYWRNRLHWVMALALACVIGLMAVGAWFGGESVYHQGTAVSTPDGTADTSAATPGKHDLYWYVGDPLQIHMILVGGLMAFTAVGLGLSIRRITLLSALQDEAVLSPGLGAPGGSAAGLGRRPAGVLPDIESLPPQPRIASTRYWFCAFLFAAATALAGYWVWGHGNGSYHFKDFWQDAMNRDNGKLAFDRSAVHVWVGIAIVVLTLILIGVVHFAQPSKVLLTIFAGLLVLLLAAQFWVGLQLAFGHDMRGSVFSRIYPPATTSLKAAKSG